MADSKIFFLAENAAGLIPFTESPYDSEEILQGLLARYYDLLPGDQIDPENPRRWFLVSRELGVPGEEGGSGRWSLDHLFLDQDGIPTFVECKRSNDTRARREVVAQMLDYAANGLEYWSVDQLRQAATETCERQGKSIDQAIMVLLQDSDEEGVAGFWALVEKNLREGKVRLIFVADETPRELRRLVEFLNEKMADVEVLAVEVKHYVGPAGKALVPRVIGLTEAARSRKSEVPRKPMTRSEFLERCPEPARLFFGDFLDRAEKSFVVKWGSKTFAMRASFDGKDATVAYGFPDGRLEVFLRDLPLSQSQKAGLRNAVLAVNLFKPAGEHTLRAFVRDLPPESALNAAAATFEAIARAVGAVRPIARQASDVTPP
ncbi:MAG: hypothetical protein U0793_27990 [Gemmataceae bacterium]